MGTPVTGDAVRKVRYALADMLGSDISLGMLMAAVASVLSPIDRRVAGGASGVVIPVEHEKACVIERGRLPAILTVAQRALGYRSAMDGRFGCGVARSAILSYRGVEQRMGECWTLAGSQGRVGMIGVTRHAILRCQHLVKRRDGSSWHNWHLFGRA